MSPFEVCLVLFLAWLTACSWLLAWLHVASVGLKRADAIAARLPQPRHTQTGEAAR